MPSPQTQAILDRLERHEHIFDLDQNGLGEDLCYEASVGAHDALVQGVDVDGNALAPLSDAYDAWKSKHYPGLPIGFRDLEMGRLDNFVGTVVVTADEATVTYGLTEQAQEELGYFCLGDPPKRPPRNVWGFTRDATQAATSILARHFTQSI